MWLRLWGYEMSLVGDVKSKFGQDLLEPFHTTHSHRKCLATKPEQGHFSNHRSFAWNLITKGIWLLIVRRKRSHPSPVLCFVFVRRPKMFPSPPCSPCAISLEPPLSCVSCPTSSSATQLLIRSRKGDIFYVHIRDTCNTGLLLLRQTGDRWANIWRALQLGRLTHSVLSSSEVKGKALCQVR